jgi:hypothetical protein
LGIFLRGLGKESPESSPKTISLRISKLVWEWRAVCLVLEQHLNPKIRESSEFKRYAYVLTSRICECDLIRKAVFAGVIKDLVIRLSWIIGWITNLMISVLIRDGRQDRNKEHLIKIE